MITTNTSDARCRVAMIALFIFLIASTPQHLSAEVGGVIPQARLPVARITALRGLQVYEGIRGFFNVILSEPASRDITIAFSVSGSATNGIDCIEIGNRITIPKGERIAYIHLIPFFDGIPEGQEKLNIRLREGDSYKILPEMAGDSLVIYDHPRLTTDVHNASFLASITVAPYVGVDGNLLPRFGGGGVIPKVPAVSLSQVVAIQPEGSDRRADFSVNFPRPFYVGTDVKFKFYGTGTLGVDYQVSFGREIATAIPGKSIKKIAGKNEWEVTVRIPAGVFGWHIYVKSLPDNIADIGETMYIDCVSGPGYIIGNGQRSLVGVIGGVIPDKK